MLIHSTRPQPHSPSHCRQHHAPKQTAVHEHDHDHGTSSFHVRESVVDISHAALEVFAHDIGNDTFVGGASAAVSALALTRGVQNLRLGGLEHTIEGVGNLALSAAGGLVAFDLLSGPHGHEAHGGGHHHGHGFGAVGILESVHGAAEIAVGALELKQAARSTIGAVRIAKGAAVIASQVIPSIAPALHLVHLGAATILAAMDPKH